MKMLPAFEKMNPNWFNRAYVYTGSVDNVFRYRIAQIETEDKKTLLQAATYSELCYELATDVETAEFPWDDAGVDALKAWLQTRYEAFCAAHPDSAGKGVLG
jgi:hypothetical protein